MRLRVIRVVAVIGLVIGVVAGSRTFGQSGTADTAAAHIAAARAAAGSDQTWMFERLCVQALGGLTAPAPARGGGGQSSGPPPRASWHAEPVKVFDNAYWLGQTEYSSWAITTSGGIILMDAIYDYSVRDEVVEGLKKLGMNPADIKYAIIGHAHGDHVGGAKTLQELFGTRILLSASDWDLLDRTGPTASSANAMPKPKRDMVVTDGQKLTLGDTAVTMYITPGHTAGTVSSLIPVKDNGTPHVAAYWGGTMYNWIGNNPQYITPKTPNKYWFDIYAASAARFRDLADKAGADVLMSNHTDFDGSKQKMPLLAKRKPGDPHPYVVGKDAVHRYLTIVGECAKAGSLMSSRDDQENAVVVLSDFRISTHTFVAALSLLLVGGALVGVSWWIRPALDGEDAWRNGDLEGAAERYGAARRRSDTIPIAGGVTGGLPRVVAANELALQYALERYDDILERAGASATSDSVAFWAGCALFDKGLMEEKPEARLGWIQQAHQEFRRALELAPDDWDAKFNFELTGRLTNGLQKQPTTSKQDMMKLLRESPRTDPQTVKKVG